MRRLPVPTAVCAALALTASACGTTANWHAAKDRASGGDDQTLGTAIGPGSSASPSPGASASSGSTGSAAKSGGAPGATTVPGQRPATSGTTAEGPIGDGRGGTGTVSVAGGVLRIGVAVPASDPASSLSGAPSNGDYPAIAKAIVADLNAHGGIAGRQIALTVSTVASANDYSGAQTEQEKVCVALTEDAHSTVVLGTDAGAAYATQCYVQHHTPVLVDKHVLDAGDVKAGAPYDLPSALANYSTTARSLPGALAAQGYLGGKVAVVAYDLPALKKAVQTVLEPGIKKAGGNLQDEAFLPPSFQEAPQAIANAIVRFRGEGIDHVVFLSGLWPLFAVQAESQQYFPRYAITTEDLPKYSYDGFHVPADQAKGLVGIGWVPGIDLTDDGAIPLSPQEKSCFAIISQRAGLTYSDRGNGSYLNGLDLCEVFRELKAALDPAKGKAIAPADVAARMARIPSSYAPTLVRSSSFRPGGTDSTGGYQWLAFGSDCNCFRYTSGLKQFVR